MGVTAGEEGGQGVSAWFLPEVRVERFRHAPGPAAPIATHRHEEYQIALSLDAASAYRLRGGRHVAPAGTLGVVQSGEAHASQAFGEGRAMATHRLLFAAPRLLREVASQAAGREAGEPCFPTPVVLDRDLARRYLELWDTLAEGAAGRLEQDVLLLGTLGRLVERHAEERLAPRPGGAEPRAVALVKACLEERLAENVSLGELARLADLTPHYLGRAFARVVGLPPHRYQVQVRVERAKALLATGMAARAVAVETGFADQSHFGRHFKRLVGVSPGRYRARVAERGEETAA